MRKIKIQGSTCASFGSADDLHPWIYLQFRLADKQYQQIAFAHVAVSFAPWAKA